MLTKTFALEFPQVSFCSVHPGWVDTDMGNFAGSNPPVSIGESCKGLQNIGEQLRKEGSGNFWSYDGKKLPY